MRKGRQTRTEVLHQALNMSTELGLEGLSIGALAKRVGMSKSGLYAHFESKEQLQCAVLDAAAASFVDRVVSPALKAPRGRPRVEALFERWLVWETAVLDGGCPFVAAATELDDRPGPVRDVLLGHTRDLTDAIERAARISVQEGHFRADLDVEHFAYTFWSNLLGYHHRARLLQSERAERLARDTFALLLAHASA